MAVIDKRDFPPLPSRKVRKRPQKDKKSDVVRKGKLATLDDLPDELLLDILDYLPGIHLENFQLPTLLALSLTNRRLHGIVSDRIYVTYDSYFCEPYLFLRTMISNPDLAGTVRNASFRYGEEAHLDRKRYMPNAQDKKIVKQGMKMLEFPDWKTWATRCNADNIELDILHTAIMLHTPNLTTLRAEASVTGAHKTAIGNYQSAKWIELIKKATIGGPFGHTHRFSYLGSVCMDASDMTIAQVAPLFRLQSLQRLNIQGLCEPFEDRPTAKELERIILPACSNIEELSFEDCSFSSDTLCTMTKSIQELKHFRYEADPSYISSSLGPDLLGGLVWHKKLLEDLHLRVDTDSTRSRSSEHFHDGDELNSLYMYSGLRSFVALRTLKCPLSSVVDMRSEAPTLTEELPPNLNTLHLKVQVWTSEKVYMQALEQLAVCHDVSLKEVLLDVEAPATRFRYDWERLVKPFSAAGIDFVVHQDADDRGFSDDSEDESTESESSGEVDLYSSDASDG